MHRTTRNAFLVGAALAVAAPAAAAELADKDSAKPVAFFTPTEVRSTGSVDGRAASASATRRSPARSSSTPRTGRTPTRSSADAQVGRQGDDKDDSPSPKPRCSTSPISGTARRRRAGRSPSCSTAAPARRPCGCTWARSARCGSQTADARHTPAAPYAIVNNDQSLLDASDLVFIDAPGTGFTRIAGKDKEKAFYGVDQDIDAFSEFITQFLSKYGRWNSPKYVFGESYGTMRAAGLALALQNTRRRLERRDLAVGHPQLGLHARRSRSSIRASTCHISSRCRPMRRPPGTTTRVADRPADLRSFLDQVESLRDGRLCAGADEGQRLARRRAPARSPSSCPAFTGLPVPYLLKTNLRIEYGAFQKELLGDQALTTGHARHALRRRDARSA